MPNYYSPGVYIEEVDKGIKPIEGVGTAVAAFIGYTQRAGEGEDGRKLLGQPVLVTNWTQYVKSFGEFTPDAYTPDAVYGYFANGGTQCYVVSIRALEVPERGEADVPARFVIASGDDKKANLLEVTAKQRGTSGNDIRVDVKPSGEEGARSFQLIITQGDNVETYDNLTTSRGTQNVEVVVNRQSALVTVKLVARGEMVPAAGQYKLAGGEVKAKSITLSDYEGSVEKRRGMGGLEPLDGVTLLLAPDLMTSRTADGKVDVESIQAVQRLMIDYCERVKYCFAILDAPPEMMPQEVEKWRMDMGYDTSRAAVYYPWIKVADQTGSNGRTRLVPPSGHMAGIYARTDATRGVHKAPANETVAGALGLEVVVTKGEHDRLNPIGVNVIRSFPGRGIRVWGARTLALTNPAWKYINVRRLFNFVEASIERGTQWVVFEPNDEDLWSRLSRDVGAFLKLVWRSGALFGSTPDKAFYVKCDAETNPPEVRDAGQLIVEIGLSPVKPAEFVVFRISQWSETGGEG